ncbi:MAG: hypothetical protein WCJ39_00985 [bacterium]
MDQSINQESINDSPPSTPTTAQTEYELQPGQKTTLKITGAKTKGLVKCLVKDRMTRQIQYVMNNLTKMTIQVDLPDITQLTQGFGDMPGFSQSYTQITKADRPTTGSFLNKYLSKQAYSSYAKNL